MDANQTANADEASTDVEEEFTYKIFKNTAMRWTVALTFVAVNMFLVIVPFISTKNPDGTVSRISTRLLPAVVLPMYLLGALAAIYILVWTPDLRFRGSGGPSSSTFVPYSNRRWIIQYKPLERQSWSVFWGRCIMDGEKIEARRLRDASNNSMGQGPQIPLRSIQPQTNSRVAYATGAIQSTGGNLVSNGRAIQPSGGGFQPGRVAQ
jgi:hypothetical protein